MTDALNRIIDANFNRASEAARVIEDCVRFGLNDIYLSEMTKSIRHELAQILQAIPSNQLLNARNSRSDVGRDISNSTEMERSDIDQLLTANLKRLQQAIRSLEEATKSIDSSIALRLEQARYESYSLEKAILLMIKSQTIIDEDWLMVLIDGLDSNDGFAARIELLITAGVRLFQLRDKRLNDRELVERGETLSHLAKRHPIRWIFNDRVDLAVVCKADGVHLGRDDLSVQQARELIGDKIIGVSTHSIEQAQQAVFDGANYIGVGPVFPSKTKSFDEFVGLNLVEKVASEISLPAFAIGGIDESNIPAVFAAGMKRVAVTQMVEKHSSKEAIDNLLDQLQSLRKVHKKKRTIETTNQEI